MLQRLRECALGLWKLPALAGRLPRWKPRLIIYDFDGVMTDNRVMVRQDGMESVSCNRGDGMGINMIRKLDIQQIILSTETNPVVLARAEKIGIPAIGGSSDKLAALGEYLHEQGIPARFTYFVGNDLNDAEAMHASGFGVAPRDAHPRVKLLAGLVTHARGGAGVVRELADLLTDRFADS
ncbi:3-deoxy-D-manno-octulosonate 8-phosphate phosphatase, YrbI family [Paucidesulfovibrio gracilis DSM 16080]|uniref:3-deoxy-D-manno-octulosonate 8-phosphate phosphatase, YrbI family n=1 Tax=Paucidesulfovibrio gracilis DSM 16080 TaxID=1121449 RepID=A0A1T4X273_9BACT|nr:HAD hydrolase family protein [Paucidesulfovibrio gracilis]SKA83743.1 3-deoxy-D-manno-octulosonate 8-phosphate phosphatase, YrbI family [Paucidesulfovibrio gracilis DSM 16080]